MVVVVLAALAACPFDPLTASGADFEVAQRDTPLLLRGSAGTGINAMLNEQLRADGELWTHPCEVWTTTQLNKLIAEILCHRDDRLDEIYRTNGDGRKLKRANISEYEARWAEQELMLQKMVCWWTDSGEDVGTAGYNNSMVAHSSG